MFSLFAGRLKIRYELIEHQWLADVIVGPKKHQSATFELKTQDFATAKEAAMEVYKRFKAEQQGDTLTCWNCQQYDAKAKRCQVGVPECRNTGGRFAVSCALYLRVKDGTTGL